MTRGVDGSVGDQAPSVPHPFASVPAAVHCPFPPRISQHAARVQRYAADWATRHGFLPTPAHRTAFGQARFALLMSRAYPDAGWADLCLAVSWLTFTFQLDDHLETVLGRAPGAQSELSGQILTYLRGGTLPPALDRLLAGALADVWERTRVRTRGGWQIRFVRHIGQYLAANVWEAENRRRQRVPPVGEYVRMRRHSAATALFFDLAEVFGGTEPADPYAEAGLSLLRLHADNVVAWFNDLVSWPKEVAGGDPHNLVLVVRHERRITLAEAVRYVVDRHDREVHAFVEAAARFRPTDPSRRLVDGLAHWIRANVDWSRESGRYAAA